MAKTYRCRNRKRKFLRKNKTNRNRNKKPLVGGSFSEAGSFFSYLINNATSVFTIPAPSSISFDPRVTNQFIH
jgi:hypothetical protein